MNTITIVAIIIAILALVGVLFLFMERQKTRKLKSHFGPEYDRTVDQEGSTRKAEAVLDQRQKRVAKYPIRPLTSEEKNHYVSHWKGIQEHFVDDPSDAISQADGLVCDAMRARGYPVTDFDRQAADLSVDYPDVVREYRAGHEIAVRNNQGQASTEDLRLAMQHYRTLFEEITETRNVERRVVREEVHH